MLQRVRDGAITEFVGYLDGGGVAVDRLGGPASLVNTQGPFWAP